MRLATITAALLIASPALAQQSLPPGPDGFKFLESSAISRLLANPQPGHVFGTARVSDHPDKGYYVEYVKRLDHGNEVEVHPAWIDQIAVIGGAGTLTIGGKVTNPRTGAGGEIRGDSQIGGVTRKLAVGDFILIPAGEPHKFVATPGKSLIYVIFKVRS